MEYIARNSLIPEDDQMKKHLLANVLYFAVSDVLSLEDAAAYADQILLDYAQRMYAGHTRRMRRPLS